MSRAARFAALLLAVADLMALTPPARAGELAWSIELASENSAFLLVKIDASPIRSNQVFESVSFEATFFRDSALQSEIATATVTVPGRIRAKLRPGVVNGFYLEHRRAGAAAVVGRSLAARCRVLGGKSDDPNEARGEPPQTFTGVSSPLADAVVINSPPPPKRAS